MAVTQLLGFPPSTQETEHQGRNWCDSNASDHLLQDPLCHLGQFFGRKEEVNDLFGAWIPDIGAPVIACILSPMSSQSQRA